MHFDDIADVLPAISREHEARLMRVCPASLLRAYALAFERAGAMLQAGSPSRVVSAESAIDLLWREHGEVTRALGSVKNVQGIEVMLHGLQDGAIGLEYFLAHKLASGMESYGRIIQELREDGLLRKAGAVWCRRLAEQLRVMARKVNVN